MTPRGMGEEEMEVIGELISDTLQSPEKASFIKQKVLELTDKFPIYKELS